MQFNCDQCSKSYKKIGDLNRHVKDCHVDESSRTCPSCSKIFASVRAKDEHVANVCPADRAKLWTPTKQINDSQNEQQRHKQSKNELSAQSVQIITMFREYLAAGSSSTFMLSRGKRNLSQSSVDTYTHHLRDFLDFFDKSETEGEDSIKYFLDLRVLKDYLSYQEKSKYTKKTILNRLFSLERLCGFIEEKLVVLNNEGFTTLPVNKRTRNTVQSVFEWIGAQIQVLSPEAAEETRIRNSKEVMEKENRWITAKQIFAKELELKPEIDLIMERISKTNVQPSIHELNLVQDYIMFLLLIQRPTMRTQNLSLKILDKVQTAKEAKENCIVLTDTEVIVQYNQYKTVKTYGFQTAYLPKDLAQYLRTFVKSIRPWFYKNKEKQTVGSFLFLNKNAEELKTIGSRFKSIMQKYFNSNASVSSIRKAMETAIAASSLPEDQKRSLSLAMLHDPVTAERYYVMKDSVEESQQINRQWAIFRQALLTQVQSPATIVSNNAIASTNNNATEVLQPACNHLELIPTSTLSSPSKLRVSDPQADAVPSLASSVCNSAEESEEEQNETTRQLADNIAQKLVHPTPSPMLSPSKFPLRPGDWPCSFCGYTNFAYRGVCNRCGKAKNKRSVYEESEQQHKKARIDSDITAILSKSTNKQGEVIYKVKSSKKGELWVRAKHVPQHLL